ncbi:hypothetical protein GCM10025862_38790 [Arsenicicoccus piscis]|uniref:Uncharacterized protein n=1 Tax=Arsenicicoccus piscis TaxID=673954 RepID=A0ABQ6HVG2_9MICO|nr:hypothetical protein GCM10025862_38790 [Arsenicicoccus piscis]
MSDRSRMNHSTTPVAARPRLMVSSRGSEVGVGGVSLTLADAVEPPGAVGGTDAAGVALAVGRVMSSSVSTFSTDPDRVRGRSRYRCDIAEQRCAVVSHRDRRSP